MLENFFAAENAHLIKDRYTLIEQSVTPSNSEIRHDSFI